MLEFIGCADSKSFLVCLVWNSPGSDQKYQRASTMFHTMQHFINYYKREFGDHPFRFYIDARFSSLAIRDEFRKAGFGYLMSVGGNAKRKTLMKWLVAGLEKREWRTIIDEEGGTFTGIRPKNRAYVRLLTNFAPANRTRHIHHRRKYPTSSFTIRCPKVQVNYNAFKNAVENFNKLVLAYYRTGHLTSEAELFFRFFVHADVVRAYLHWRESDPSRSDSTQKAFRLSVLDELQQEFAASALQQDPTRSPHRYHWPSPMPKSRERTRCSQSRCSSRVSVYCAACGKYLCLKCSTALHARFVATKFP